MAQLTDSLRASEKYHELFEALTLIQTGKVRNFPVVLFDTDYWAGLMDWMRGTLAGEGKISPEDLDLLFLTDSPEEVVEHVLASQPGSVPRVQR